MYNTTFDFSGLENIIDDIDNIESTFQDTMLESAIEIEQQFIPQLAKYPDKRAVHPFQFATPKSRRYYFYLISTGQVQTDDYGYVRNGGYGRSWQVDVYENGNEYTIEVFSTFPAAIHVGGNRQVRGHANTGWQLYHLILDSIDEFASRAFFDTINEEF